MTNEPVIRTTSKPWYVLKVEGSDLYPNLKGEVTIYPRIMHQNPVILRILAEKFSTPENPLVIQRWPPGTQFPVDPSDPEATYTGREYSFFLADEIKWALSFDDFTNVKSLHLLQDLNLVDLAFILAFIWSAAEQQGWAEGYKDGKDASEINHG